MCVCVCVGGGGICGETVLKLNKALVVVSTGS